MLDEAIVSLQTAVRSPRQRFEAAAALGRVYDRRGEPTLAIEWLERAAEAPAPSPEEGRAPLDDLGVLLDGAGRPRGHWRCSSNSRPTPATTATCLPASIASHACRPEADISFLTRILFAAYFLEAGLILIVAPWSGFWDRNLFLYRFPRFRKCSRAHSPGARSPASARLQSSPASPSSRACCRAEVDRAMSLPGRSSRSRVVGPTLPRPLLMMVSDRGLYGALPSPAARSR